MQQCRDKDYAEAIEKLTEKLNIWQGRYLSLLGKIQVLKSCGISQVLYVMNMSEPTKQHLDKINAELYKFLWGNNYNKVKSQSIISNYDQGGLKMPDVYTFYETQRIMWVKRFFNESDHTCKSILEWQLSKVGGEIIILQHKRKQKRYNR